MQEPKFSIQTAAVTYTPHPLVQVLALLEGLVSFMSSNEGVFLHAMTAAEEPEEGLKRLGAPPTFISTFMVCHNRQRQVPHAMLSWEASTTHAGYTDIQAIAMPCATPMYCWSHAACRRRGGVRITHSTPTQGGCMQEVVRIAGGLHGPRIITFGDTATLSPQAAASVFSRFHAAVSPAGSPRATSPCSARVFPRTTKDMLEDLRPGDDSAQKSQDLSSMVTKLARVSDAVVTPVKALPPAIITALEETAAAPFLFFRWITPCLVEVRRPAPPNPTAQTNLTSPQPL